MRAIIIPSLVLCLCGCTVTLTVEAGFYVRPTSFRTTSSAPPPLRADGDRGAKPDPGAIWVTGYWDWQGSWVWVPGAWKKPEPDHVWEPPVCVAWAGDYRYYPGYFRPRDEDPPEVYREPGHIRVHVPNATPVVTLPERVTIVPGQPAPTQTGPRNPERPDVQPTTDPTSPTGLPTQQPTTGRPDVGTPDGPDGPDVPDTQATLSCRLTIARVPRSGGNFTIEGSGFAEDVVVKVGGTTQVIRLRTSTQIQARTTSSGTVRVIQGNTEAECGRLELF